MDTSNDRERPVTQPDQLFTVLVIAFLVIAAVLTLWMLLISARHLALGSTDVRAATVEMNLSARPRGAGAQHRPDNQALRGYAERQIQLNM